MPRSLELLREPDDTELFVRVTSDAWMKPTGYVSILHAIDLPDVGGDTAFSSTISAFEALSDGMKKLLRTQKAIHAFHWRENGSPALVLRTPCSEDKPQNKKGRPLH